MKASEAEFNDYMERWKAAGNPVTLLTCPCCQEQYEVPQIPDTDSLMRCPKCSGLIFKVIDTQGVATATVF